MYSEKHVTNDMTNDTGSMISIRAFDGGEFSGYLALPAGGRGPGVVVLQEIFGVGQNMREVCDWYAARGFAAICPDLYWRIEPGLELTEKDSEKARGVLAKLDQDKAVEDAAAALDFLRGHPSCNGRVGAVGFCLGGRLAYFLAVRYKPDAAVGYYGVGIEKGLGEAGNLACPLMLHFGGLDKYSPPEVIDEIRRALESEREAQVTSTNPHPDGWGWNKHGSATSTNPHPDGWGWNKHGSVTSTHPHPDGWGWNKHGSVTSTHPHPDGWGLNATRSPAPTAVHVYPNSDHAFARRTGAHYDAAAAELADLRTLEFFVQTLVVKPYSLEAIWAEHINHEFSTRSTEDTLATMVEDAYVNHIPILTGGVGKDQLREFYSKHFIPKMPPDTSLSPISRTVGEDQIVDEMIFRFTHTIEMDWMLPGIEPTGKRVEVPLVAIVKLRGDKLAHEHIYWDQASVLVQLGLVDAGALPVAGIESARKAEDPKLAARKLE
jgi:dienelactone hydrolase